MGIPALSQCLVNLEHAHLLVDTCFLIDASRSMEQDRENSPYVELLRLFDEQGNTLVTIFPVSLEYLKGSDVLHERRIKKGYYDSLIKTTLPVDATIVQHADSLTQLYRSSGKNLSPTDFLLGATLMRYGATSKFYLLTRDHGDFPLKIFDRERVLVLEHPNAGIDTYALFAYSATKIANIERQLLEIDKKNTTSSNHST